MPTAFRVGKSTYKNLGTGRRGERPCRTCYELCFWEREWQLSSSFQPPNRPPLRVPSTIYLKVLLKGSPILVRLDTCGGGHLRGDQGSSLRCGGDDYKIQYPNAPNWCPAVVTGPNARDKNKIVTNNQYCNSDPTGHQISLWGRVMTFNDQGVVFDRDPPYPPVGHLLFVGTPAPGGQSGGGFSGECLCNYHSEIFSCGNSGVVGSSCQDLATQCARKTNGHGYLGRTSPPCH